MIWLPLLLSVMVVLACLMARDFRRQRDGARQVALQAKQGWDRAIERESCATLRQVALEAEVERWKKAARDSMSRELKLMQDKA